MNGDINTDHSWRLLLVRLPVAPISGKTATHLLPELNPADAALVIRELSIREELMHISVEINQVV